MGKRGILVLALTAAAVLASLAGCAENKERHNDEDLDRIVRWLPGTYDNTAQAKADAQKGVPLPHDAVELDIVPLESVSVGRNSFYMQEMAADDARRVLSQKVVSFSVTKKGIVESISALVDPLRWRDGQEEPDIFTGMTPRDLKAVSGCELIWKRADEGNRTANKEAAKAGGKKTKEQARKAAENLRFVGANDPKRCQTTSHAVMGLVNVELRGELSANEFATAQLQYETGGQLVEGNKEEPFYRFRKIGK